MAEPAWKEADNFRIPDIVIASDSRITDIFELKFVPHGYADPKDDLAKLVEYSSAGCCSSDYPAGHQLERSGLFPRRSG